MQRAAFDLLGVARRSATTSGRGCGMAAWPIDRFPLRRDFAASPTAEPGQEDYAFVKVEGDGVHEIPVGPVHAGIIEPGHFRFSGRRREGAAARGAPRLRAQGHREALRSIVARSTAQRLAGRVSGDSTVAYAWAYAQALEGIAGVAPPARAAWLRALCLERERHREPSRRPRRPRQRRRLRVRPRAILALEGRRAARERGRLRPPLPDGRRRARRRRARPRLRHVHAMLDEAERAGARGARTARASTTSTPACRIASATAASSTPDLAAQLGLLGLAGRASGQAHRPARATLPVRARTTSCSTCAIVHAPQRRRRRARRGALRRDARVAAADRDDHSRRCPIRRRRDACSALADIPPGRVRRSATSKAGADRCSSRSKAAPAARSAAAIRTIRRGRTGR